MIETQDKLNWLAFRYVANELNATETSEFEARLLTDQSAREAVAHAVEQTTHIRQALADAAVHTAASQRSNWGRQKSRVAIVALGSCLSLLLAICLVRSSLPVADDVAFQTVTDDLQDSPAQLAYAWAEARHGSAESQPPVHAVLADSLDAVLIASIDSDPEQSLAAPSWMLAALAKMDGGFDTDIEIQE